MRALSPDPAPRRFRHWPARLFALVVLLLLVAALLGLGAAPPRPAAPVALGQVAATPVAVTISWRRPPGREPLRYSVYRAGRRLTTTSRTLFTLRGLACATRHRVGVEGVAPTGRRSRRVATVVQTKPCRAAAPGQPSSGRTYYVSPRGSDRSAGTSVAPFRTIQRAADQVRPGDTVLVRAGTYTEAGCDDAMVCIEAGGTATAPVTFKSERRWQAVLDGSNTVSQGFDVKVDYVRIDGFEIRGFANPEGSGGGITLFSGGRGSTISNNHIHHIGRVCTDTSNGQKGIYLKQSDVTIEGNYIHDIGRLAPGEGGCSYDSDYEGWQNHDHGIYTSANDTSLSGTVIRGNYFANHERGWAIHIYPGDWQDVTIDRNVFVNGNPYRSSSHIVVADVTIRDSRITRNLFVDRDGGAAIRLSGDELSVSAVLVAENRTNQPALTIGPTDGLVMLDNETRASVATPRPPGG